MNIPFFSNRADNRILTNKPRKKGELWKRKTCKTCGFDYCYLRKKPKNKACNRYEPKIK